MGPSEISEVFCERFPLSFYAERKCSPPNMYSFDDV